MKALVSTSFSVIAVDMETSAAFAIERGNGPYFGIGRTDRGLVFGAGRRLGSPENPMSEEDGCLLFYHDGKSYLVEPQIALRGLHGLAVIDRSVCIICTLNDKIVVYSDSAWSEWLPLGPTGPGENAFHFSKVLCEGDRIFVLAHNGCESEVLEFDKTNRTLLRRRRIGVQAYNIWFDGDKLRVCSSAEGRIIGTDGLLVDIGAFPRGYACDTTKRLIGVCEANSRAELGASLSALVLMDMEYQELKRVCLPGEGMIMDILAITDAEYAELEGAARQRDIWNVPPLPWLNAAEAMELLQARNSQAKLVRSAKELTNARNTLAAQLAEVRAAHEAAVAHIAELTAHRDQMDAQIKGFCNYDPLVQADLLDLLRRLEPMSAEGFAKVRVGRPNDGGYVMIDDFAGVDAAYSFGISDDVSWDGQIADLGVDVFQYDHTIEALPEDHARFFWRKLGVGPAEDEALPVSTLSAILLKNGHRSDADLILKMDVEGAEWDVFSAIEPSELDRFRQIVVEMHFLDKFVDPAWRRKMLDAVTNLTTHHQLVHVHANNWGCWSIMGGIALPTVLELTLVRRRGKVFVDRGETFPTPIDMPNRADRADYHLGHFCF